MITKEKLIELINACVKDPNMNKGAPEYFKYSEHSSYSYLGDGSNICVIKEEQFRYDYEYKKSIFTKFDKEFPYETFSTYKIKIRFDELPMIEISTNISYFDKKWDTFVGKFLGFWPVLIPVTTKEIATEYTLTCGSFKCIISNVELHDMVKLIEDEKLKHFKFNENKVFEERLKKYKL